MPTNAYAKSRGEWWRSEGGRSHRGSEGAKSAKSTLAWASPVQSTSTIPDAALQALCSQHNKRMPSALGATGPDFGDRTPVDHSAAHTHVRAHTTPTHTHAPTPPNPEWERT